MVEKKDASDTIAEAMEKSEQQALARKAYGQATTRLREQFKEDFNYLLTEEYAKLGVTVRRRRTAEEQEQAKVEEQAERAAKKEAKRQAKIAKMEAELEALKASTDPSASYDELALQDALTSITTADQPA
jgi:CRISPR/Cas system CSM-associated protein Csm4 (group 5 of RAMP superfamily)